MGRPEAPGVNEPGTPSRAESVSFLKILDSTKAGRPPNENA